MLNEKISITKQIKELIVNARNSINLTASDVSEQIKGSIYWLPNIENGRTKSILKSDLIQILVLSYKCSNDEAEEMIVDALKTSSVDTSDDDLADKEIRLYKGTEVTLEDISKYQKDFEDSKRDIIKGFDFFYNKVENKENALDVVKSIRNNLHSDLGFIISLYSLPWCKVSALTVEEKKKIMSELFDMIKEKGNCDACRTRNKKNNNCSDSD